MKSLIQRAWSRYRISAAETDHHDLHQRAEIGLALVHRDRAEAQRLLATVRRQFEETGEAFLTRWDESFAEDWV